MGNIVCLISKQIIEIKIKIIDSCSTQLVREERKDGRRPYKNSPSFTPQLRRTTLNLIC